MIKILKTFFIIIFLSVSFFAGIFFYIVHYPIIDFSIVTHSAQGFPSIVYDSQGKEWTRFCYDRRDPVKCKQIPNHVIQAFIAAEDWNFYHHHGLSFRSIIRSFLVNLRHGRIVQGGSTITQQLVKMLYYDNSRTFKRKIKEQFLTLLIEQHFSKEQILETYLNNVYFGSGLYGIAAAAHRFWNIKVQDLSVEQAALLAGIICSPGHYSPLLFPYSALHRRNIILYKMEKLKFISLETCKALTQQPLDIQPAALYACAPYAKEYIRTFLEQKYGKKMLYEGGLSIKTTLHKDMQMHAQESFTTHFAALKKLYGADLEGALVSIDKKTGALRAVIGGTDFAQSHFNRAFYARRQQGSIFKPLLYAAALDKGMSLSDTAIDEPIKIHFKNQIWQPRNHTKKFEGQMTLARALSFSNNIISAKVLLYIGAQSVVDLAYKCRLQGPIMPYPSLALGCLDSTALEVTGMFNIFANNGIYCKPYLVESVTDRQGTILYKHTHESEKILPTKIAHQIAHLLTLGLERKKRYAHAWIDSQALSKTGTTNDSRTCWFAGSTPEITTVVYVGADDNRPLGKNVFPLHTAYPIWLSYHLKIPTKQKEFIFDESLQEALVDWKTGQIVQEKQDGKEIYPLLF